MLLPALVLVSLMIGLIMTNIDRYESEKKFTKELVSKFQVDHLFFLARNELLKMLANDVQDLENGILYFNNGSVAYAVGEMEEPFIHIEMRATNNNNSRKFNVSMVYDLNEGKIVQWVE